MRAQLTFNDGDHAAMLLMLDTGHTLAVCASAVFLGRTAATVGSALYAVAALAGLPVYTGWRRGVHKPTIGYVVGFSACAWLVGSGKNKPLSVFVRCCVGQFATLLIGSTWLIFPGYAETLPAAWTLGVRPYLGGALVKSFLVASAVALFSWRRARSPASQVAWARHREQRFRDIEAGDQNIGGPPWYAHPLSRRCAGLAPPVSCDNADWDRIGSWNCKYVNLRPGGRGQRHR